MIINPYRYAAATNPASTYHRVDYKQGSEGYVSVSEIKFKLSDDSDYPLTGATFTSYAGWTSGDVAAQHNGTITDLVYCTVGANNWAGTKIQTTSAVSVKSVMTATQANFNGPYNVPIGVRYYTSTDGTTWTLAKEVLGYLGTATGYIETNVSP